MSSEWAVSELGKEAINASRPFLFKGHPNVVFVNTGDVLAGKFLHSTVSESKGLPGQAKKALRKNDILLTEIRPGNGRYAYVDFDVSNYVVSTKFMVIETQGRVSPRFLYHVLTNRAALDEFQRIAESRSGTFPQITFDSIAHFPVPTPTAAEQENLVKFLDALDDRITLLRETNATLEAIAQAIFKSWFVDFDPVLAKQEGRPPEGMDEATAALFPDSFEESALGLVPRGWRVSPVSEVVDTVGGGTPDTKDASYWEPAEYCWTTPKDLSGISAPVLLETERKLSAKGVAKISSGLLPAGTLLMSSRAPIGYLAITQTPMAINQGYIAMLPGSTVPPLYMLYWCRHSMDTIKSHANGSTFMEISKKAFRPLPTLVPPANLLEQFAAIAGALFERLVDNAKQTQTLATLRDTLLPRLISGQLRLPDAEVVIAETVA
jgi:type I restriction enzyme S subunit